MSKPSQTVAELWIVGPGRVGQAVAQAEQEAGGAPLVVGRHEGPWQETLAAGGARTSRSTPAEVWSSEAALPRLLFFAVPDDALAVIAAAWAADCPDPDGLQVAHASGVHGLDALAAFPLSSRLVLHPLRAFPAQAGGRSPWRGTPVTVTASLASVATAGRAWVARWGAQAFELNPSVDRARYHLACCLAANHVTSLLAWAEELLGEGMQADEARLAALALAESALSRTREVGPASALTGPVARLDLGTLQAHLRALRPDERARYFALLGEVGQLAERGGRWSEAQRAAWQQFLAGEREGQA